MPLPTTGAGPSSPTGSLGPPTVAPILSVTAEFESYIAQLSWTPSNRTDTAGFGYRIYMQVDGGGFNELSTTTSTTYNHDAGLLGGDYEFYVEPYNDSGEGPSSNTASVILPGEQSNQLRYTQSGVGRTLQDGTPRYLQAA